MYPSLFFLFMLKLDKRVGDDVLGIPLTMHRLEGIENAAPYIFYKNRNNKSKW